MDNLRFFTKISAALAAATAPWQMEATNAFDRQSRPEHRSPRYRAVMWRGKYMPHQGKQEKARRLRKMQAGMRQ